MLLRLRAVEVPPAPRPIARADPRPQRRPRAQAAPFGPPSGPKRHGTGCVFPFRSALRTETQTWARPSWSTKDFRSGFRRSRQDPMKANDHDASDDDLASYDPAVQSSSPMKSRTIATITTWRSSNRFGRRSVRLAVAGQATVGTRHHGSATSWTPSASEGSSWTTGQSIRSNAIFGSLMPTRRAFGQRSRRCRPRPRNHLRIAWTHSCLACGRRSRVWDRPATPCGRSVLNRGRRRMTRAPSPRGEGAGAERHPHPARPE